MHIDPYCRNYLLTVCNDRLLRIFDLSNLPSVLHTISIPSLIGRVVAAKWLHPDFIVTSSDCKQVNAWRLKDLITMQPGALKKNKRKRSAKGELQSDDEESKTESSSLVVK